MDTFLVVLALVLVFVCAFAFTADMNRAMQLEKKLKVLAEDCAEAAALCIDESASVSEGKIIVDLAAGQTAAEILCSLSDICRLFPQTSSLKVRVEQEESGAVAAEVSWEGGDLFRLAGIKKTQASRKAAYAWDR